MREFRPNNARGRVLFYFSSQMKTPAPGEVTQILEAITSGDRQAIHQLFPIVYEQLRKMAKARMAREQGNTLQTTGLVHELYLRLLKEEEPRWENRKHFFAVAAEAMRRILIENARRRATVRRGRKATKITLQENMLTNDSDPQLLLIMDQALTRLHSRDSLMSEVVKLHCFAGLTIHETALVLGTSPRNVDRQWAAAKAWLYKEMVESGKSGQATA